jgi:ubiquinone/menaquinone biosynthesis C-methylase UbiE
MPDSGQQNFSQRAGGQEPTTLVQQRFGATAQAYATSSVHASGPDLQWLVEAAALTGQECVVDLATGAGHTAFALAPYAREVIAIDITEPMLATARQLADERHLTNIRFLKGDATALPLPDASVECVACRYAAHHFSPIAQAVKEWQRVLKTGGKLLLSDTIAPEEPEIDVFVNKIELLRDSSHIRNLRLSEWLLLLKENGFAVNIQRRWEITMDMQSWTQRMKTPPEHVAQLKRMFNEAPAKIKERFHIEPFDDNFSFSLPVALLLAIKQ